MGNRDVSLKSAWPYSGKLPLLLCWYLTFLTRVARTRDDRTCDLAEQMADAQFA